MPRRGRLRQYLINMATLDNAISLIQVYIDRYKVKLEVTEPFDLFPENSEKYSIANNSWPGNHRAGAYLILNPEFEVIYIGQSDSLGRRFSQYFKSCGGKCEIIHPHSWNGLPRYIVSVVVPKKEQHIRLSLEEYLIQGLDPIDNIRGRVQ